MQSQLTAHRSPLTAHSSLLTAHHSLLTPHHSPLTTHHSPLTYYYFLPARNRLLLGRSACAVDERCWSRNESS